MMFQNEITISGYDALKFQSMMEKPESLALMERDEFVSDVDIEVLENGEITISCNCDFDDFSRENEICDVLTNTKEKRAYDTTSINVESSKVCSVATSRLTNNAWLSSQYRYGKGYQYTNNKNRKKEMCISNAFAFAS